MTNLAATMDEEMVELVTPKEVRPRRLKWAGLAVTAAAVVGVVGWRQSQHKLSPLVQLSTMHHGLARAFSNFSTPSTNVKLDFLLNQVGKPEPSGMSVSAEISESEQKFEWPSFIVTLRAVEGKQAALKTQIKAILDVVLENIKDSYGYEDVRSTWEQMVSVKNGQQNDTVDISIRLPAVGVEERKQMQEKMDAKIAEAVEGFKPSFKAELSIGRTIQEILDNEGENPVTLPGGVKASVDTHFASILLAALAPAVPYQYCQYTDMLLRSRILEGFASINSKLSFLYKSKAETEEAFKMMPSLEYELLDIRHDFVAGLPHELRAPLSKLDAVDGLTEVKMTDLPGNYQVVAKFTNWHLLPLISELVDTDNVCEAWSWLLRPTRWWCGGHHVHNYRYQRDYHHEITSYGNR